MSFSIGSEAVPLAPIEEPSMPSVPIGTGAFPSTSFDVPPAYSSNPEIFRAPIHSSPIRIDACALERNCYDRCYSQSSCNSSEHCNSHSPHDEHDSNYKCCGIVCILLVFILCGVVAMAGLGIFN